MFKLRNPAITEEYRDQQENKKDWDLLTHVLNRIEDANDPDFTKKVFDQILLEIYNLLKTVKVTYPTPNRISQTNALAIIREFIVQKSGGDSIEAITTALFKTIGEKFQLFDEVSREKVNVSDQSSGMAGDIECRSDQTVILLIEVKAQQLTLTQLSSTINSARANQIGEVLFMLQNGVNPNDEQKIHEKVQQEFNSGQNIYISDIEDFIQNTLILLGENGRTQFINQIGQELDLAQSSIDLKKQWAKLLRKS